MDYSIRTASNGNGDFRDSNGESAQVRFPPVNMEVDEVDSPISSRNGIPTSRGESESGFNIDRNNEGYDVQDILIPPATASMQAQDQSTENAGNVEGNQPDSRSFFSLSLLRKLYPSSSNVAKPSATISAGFDDLMYNMEHPRRGKCIIFNHTKFDKSQQLPDRLGTDIDVKNINCLFRKLGFVVSVHDDCKFKKIMDLLQSVSKEDHSQNDCLAVFVLSHGLANSEVHAYDITYKVSTLWDVFTADKCSTLAGKPKMFFIQACRGFQFDHGTKLYSSRTEVDGPGGGNGEQMYRIPNQADFLTVFSTYEATKECGFLNHSLHYMSLSAGYYSWRNNKSGSCFVHALCKIFTDWYQFKDVVSMLTMVNRDVALNYESRSKDTAQSGKKQTPHVCHTLMRDIVFLPKLQSTLV